MDNKELAKRLLFLCGGKENIIIAENCMTRLRVELKDKSKADLDSIKKTRDALGLVDGDGEIQIVLGPGKVARVAEEFQKFLKEPDKENNSSKHITNNDKDEDWKKNKESHKSKIKLTAFQDILKKISKIFIPLIPGIMACGLLLGISELINSLMLQNLIEKDGIFAFIALIFSVLGKTCMSFLTIYVGINSAKVFKCTTILGGMIGALVVLDDIKDIAEVIQMILDYYIQANPIVFYNENAIETSLLYPGKGGVIGVIIGVWILSKIEHGLRKIVPDTLDLIITPLICFLCVGLLMLLLIMPVAGILSDGIAEGLQALSQSPYAIVRWLYGFLLGALYLPLVLFGLHQGLMPIYMLEITQNGYTTMICPQLMAGFAQVGAAICIYIKCRQIKHSSMCKTIAGGLPAGLLGIGEPLIYGMSLPLAIVFIPIGIAAGCAGIFIVMMNCKALSFGPSALLGVVTMDPGSMIPYLIGGAMSIALGFIFTFFVVKKKRLILHKESSEESLSGEESFNDLVRS